MRSLGLPLDLNLLAGQLLLVVLFLIPGLNATWLIERLAGRSTFTGTERFLRALTLSVLIYALASPWLLRVGTRVAAKQWIWPWEPIIGLSILIFVAPLALGFGWAWLRNRERLRSAVRQLTDIESSPTSWDYVFTRGKPYMVRVKLSDGERVGGLFGPESNASLYPEPQDLYLEEAWRLDDDGRFVRPVEDSEGLLIRHENVEIVELLRVETDNVDAGVEGE